MALFTATATGVALTIGATSVTVVSTTSTFLATVIATTLNVVVGTVLSVAVSAVTGALAGKPSTAALGVRTRVQTGGAVPRSFMLGRGATAGSLVWANTWNNGLKTPNAFLTQVIALSDLPVKGLRRVFVNGEAVTLGATADPDGRGYPVVEYQSRGQDFLWVKFYDGTQTTADSFLTGTASSTDRPWESTRVGVGVAYAIVTARFNQRLFNGLPQFIFELDGAALYDPSRDGSEEGTGAHRWATPSTWDDATDSRDLTAVQIYNLLRGVSYGGDWLYGAQTFGAAQLPAAEWAAAVEKCRTLGFKTGGEVRVDVPVKDVLEALLAGCIGRVSDDAGTAYRLTIGDPGAAAATITDDDIISTSPQSFTPFPGLADTVNGVVLTYPSPDQAWAQRTAPPLYDAALEAEDGGRRLPVALDLPYVYDDEQAQRVVRAALKEARRARRHTIVLPDTFSALKPGDAVSWTSARNGYTARLFRVDGVVVQGDLDVMVDLTEVDADDYDWDAETDFVAVTEGFAVPARPAAQEVPSFAVAAASVPDAAGVNRRPALRLTWDGDVDDATGIEWEVRVQATSTVVARGSTHDVAAGELWVIEGLIASTAYEARARLVAPRETDWTSWAAATTGDFRVDTADLADDAASEYVAQTVNDEFLITSTGWVEVASLSVDRTQDGPLDCWLSLTQPGGVKVRALEDGTVFATTTGTLADGQAVVAFNRSARPTAGVVDVSFEVQRATQPYSPYVDQVAARVIKR